MEYYTSDHPIIIFTPIRDGFPVLRFGAHQYSAKEVEIFFPLTPRLCLILYDWELSDYKLFKSTRFVQEDELEWINRQIIAKAYRTLFTKKNDFEFIRKILRDFPELRDLNRSRIHG